MKFFIAFLLIGVFAAATFAAVDELEQQGIAQEAIDNLEALRIRKAARSYGAAPAAPAYGPSVPSIPCPKNYLFSCQPHLQPVACAPPPAYHQGAYSEPIAQWALPPQEN